MPPTRVLVAYKKSALQTYVEELADARVRELLERDDKSVASFRSSDREHRLCLEEVRRVLAVRGLEATFVFRGQLRGRIHGVDLVITVGGDGTVLDVSHRIAGPGIPVLGVNSDPSISTGFYCGTDRHAFEATLDAVLAGRARADQLARLRLRINGQQATPPALNEVLIAHPNPAATSRYFLRHGEVEERQRSSGIWVATAAGSTAAIRSAGGQVMPLSSRRLQFLVREAVILPGQEVPRLLRGLVAPGEALEVTWALRAGRVFVDGPHTALRVEVGDRLEVTGDAPPLTVLAMPTERWRMVGAE